MISYLKIQFRQGLFFIPLIIIPIILFTKNYLFIFFFLQTRFFNCFKQPDFHLLLFNVTGADLNTQLKHYNLSWLVWFNVWFVIAQTINLILYDVNILMAITQLINFNITLFICFIVGNTLSNSDIITIKSGFLRLLGNSFIFNMSISISYTVSQITTLLNITPLVNITFLLGVITVWHYHTLQQTTIKYKHYYL